MFKKRILLTGGAGFIGSNLVNQLVNKYTDYQIVVFDKLTYAGNKKNLSLSENKPNYLFIEGDICDVKKIDETFATYHITDIIHLAAESHVDNSISGPRAFINTNILGTFNLLEVARKYWMESPFSSLPGFNHSKFHHISTDEVYGTLGLEGQFSETTPYSPNSPYSASKASSDHLVRSYFHTYGLQTVTTNCSNNYGPYQHQEKLIPTIIRKAISDSPIPIYGNGQNIRDWLFVEDHCQALDLVFHKGESGETYNIGGNCEMTNIDIANFICSELDKLKPKKDKKSYKQQIAFVKDRPGHDLRYAVDCNKIKTTLGWEPQTNFESGINKTIKWYLEQFV